LYYAYVKGIQIIKRDGSKEPFYPWKIQRVVMAAGLDPEQSNKCTNAVTDWVMNLNKKELPSLELRDKVHEELKRIDQYSANMFEWYQKTKTDHGKN